MSFAVVVVAFLRWSYGVVVVDFVVLKLRLNEIEVISGLDGGREVVEVVCSHAMLAVTLVVASRRRRGRGGDL